MGQINIYTSAFALKNNYIAWSSVNVSIKLFGNITDKTFCTNHEIT